MEDRFNKISAPQGRMFSALRKSETALGRHGMPDDRFRYPVEKRRNKENSEAMQRAEAALDTFWAKVDAILHLNCTNLDGLSLKPLLVERTLQRTADWVERSKSKNTAIESLTKPLSEIYFDLQRRTESTLKPHAERRAKQEKTKTRGAPAPGSEEAITEPNLEDPQPTFSVDQRALKVFRTLFYTPSLTSTLGEVAWPDFLFAMSTVGFRPEKLYGSVWQFSPTKLDVERSIQYHEPHPSGKIPYWISRSHGRRLNRASGWHSQMFVLAEKN